MDEVLITDINSMFDDYKVIPIDPPIYHEFNYDKDQLMKALEYLRQILPNYFTDLPNSTKYFLMVFGDFLGNSFPAIGIGCNNQEDIDMLPTFLELYGRIEKLIEEKLTIEKIRNEMKEIKIISWEELQELKYYSK